MNLAPVGVEHAHGTAQVANPPRDRPIHSLNPGLRLQLRNSEQMLTPGGTGSNRGGSHAQTDFGSHDLARGVGRSSSGQFARRENWLSTFIDPRGITNSATAVAVQPNGLMAMTLSVSGSGGSGRQMLTLAYRMTGENSYMTRVVEYGAEQMCGAGVCLPVPPMAPLGTTSSCQFTITDNIILTVSCDGQQPILVYEAVTRRGQSASTMSLSASATVRALALRSRMTLPEASRNWTRYCMVRDDNG